MQEENRILDNGRIRYQGKIWKQCGWKGYDPVYSSGKYLLMPDNSIIIENEL